MDACHRVKNLSDQSGAVWREDLIANKIKKTFFISSFSLNLYFNPREVNLKNVYALNYLNVQSKIKVRKRHDFNANKNEEKKHIESSNESKTFGLYSKVA